jgi:quinol monooxygenase YgiN/ketosteroid isomerase-like protein
MQETTVSAVGFARAKPEKAAELAALFITLTDRARGEQGCLVSQIHRDLADPHLFVFYETWASEEDVNRHLAQPYMTEFLAGRMTYLAEDLQVRQLGPALTGPAPESADPADPAEMNGKYLDAYGARDVQAIMALYAPGASSVWQPGSTISGTAHRDAIAEFFKKEPKLTAEVRQRYVLGDVAALVVDWSIEVPGGPEMTGSGTGFDVLKKNADGHWRYIITNPFGRP